MRFAHALATVLAAAFVTLPALAQAEAKPAMHIGGRTTIVTDVLFGYDPDGVGRGLDSDSHAHQWPGIYAETRFKGRKLNVYITDSHNRYKLYIDDQPPKILSGHSPVHEIRGLKGGWHAARLEKISESQDHVGHIYGFRVRGGRLEAPAPRSRQIEFIGDSHTVGYGNTSATRDCTAEDVHTTTDTSQAFGPVTAKHYNADYQINAYSGRGIVRNYNGFKADTLPALYPYTLFDAKTAYADPAWQPQLIVIGLGTNDFSTPLNAGEPWQTRAELHADYQASYVRFVQSLRANHPNAWFILTATDQMEGEYETQVKAVMATLQTAGESRIAFLRLPPLEMSGCHWHPSTADSQKISAALIAWIDTHPQVWEGN